MFPATSFVFLNYNSTRLVFLCLPKMLIFEKLKFSWECDSQFFILFFHIFPYFCYYIPYIHTYIQKYRNTFTIKINDTICREYNEYRLRMDE